MKLRDYQVKGERAVHHEWESVKSTAVVLPTGMGKTVLFAAIIKSRLPRRALVIAHREELVTQARQKIEHFAGVECGIEMAELYVNNSLFGEQPVVVSTVQTLNSAWGDRHRMGRFKPTDFDTLICDECHHSVSPSYRRVFDYFSQNPNLKIAGFSATPDRLDEIALGQIYETVAFDVEILDAIHDGWLVPIEQQFVSVAGLDFSDIRTTAGDLNGADLSNLMEAEKIMQGVCGASIQIIGDKRAIVFTCSVKQAEQGCEIFNRHKSGMAAWVCGATNKDQRREMLQAFKDGKIQVVFNCGVLTEGFDDDGVEVIVMARPTKSRSLYAQMCLDSSTEVLTDNGWKSCDTIDALDNVAAMNMKSGGIDYVRIEDHVDRELERDEAMYGISSPTADIRVSDQHDMVVSMRNGRSRKKSGWFKIEARNINREFFIPCAGNPHYKEVGLYLADDELRFIGWFLTDGTLNKKTNQITITQGEHQPWIKKIDDCLRGCGFKYGKSTKLRKTQFNQTSPCVRYTISKGAPRGTGKHLQGWGRLERYMKKDLDGSLLFISQKQFVVLLEAIHLGDGKKHGGKGFHISTANRKFADNLQIMCIHHGYSCNIAQHDYNKNPLFELHIKPSAIRSVKYKSSDGRGVWGILPRSYPERVWCLTNELGTLVTRRNGKVAIVGNCGRATRPLAGLVDPQPTPELRKAAIASSSKPRCLILDFVGNSGKHKLMSTADILGGKVSEEAVRRAIEKAKASGAVRMDELLDEEEQAIRAEAEKRRLLESARRAKLVAKVTHSARVINPFDAFDIEPVRERGWDSGKTLSEKQSSLLLKQGINPDTMNYSQGRQVLNEMFRRWNLKLCTIKQAALLKRYGYETKNMTMKQAGELITGLKSKGWQKPAVLQPVSNRDDNVPF